MENQQIETIETTEEPRKWSKEDINEASDLKTVMEAYHGNKKDKYASLSELQTTVAERLNQIGEEEKGFQFEILAGQTRNVEAMEKQTEVMDTLSSEIEYFPNKLKGQLEDVSSGFERGLKEQFSQHFGQN